ncbi:Polysaccharide lyase family 8 protein [Mycena venus]|uniref:Polysaccharide lyase family 8 protein n=1 Tax=Mycena venus TaxID=2733690 RepID=A0A8H6XUI5_9AGAR|nr:Polysaccharide lyase family 8 protein [Mycena venus]
MNLKTTSLLSFIFYISSLSRVNATSPHDRIARQVQVVVSESASISIATPTSSTQTNSLPTASVSANATTIVASSLSATQSSASASSAPTASSVAQDIETLHQRRLSNIVGELTNASSISSWLSTLNSSGQWPDVDYTTGCPAQRANWPAENHWVRISTMAGAYHGGGTATCPCGTPGLWNTNWFPNIIGTPELVSMTCLLLNETLLPEEFGNCTTMTGRAYNTFIVPANQVGVLTGANALDVAKIGIDLALLTVNVSLLTDAYSRVHSQMVITTAVKADGIRPDGSFGQHSGIIYNGNYGKDFTNDIVDLEVEAGATQFQASPAGQSAFETLFDGDAWMIYKNVLTGVLHWDFSVLGRFISFPTADFTQATGSILLNLTKIGVLGEEWGSDTLINFSTSLSQNVTSANAGNLQGNHMFYNNDYMVQRGAGYGNEYEDIAAAMDWNLIPGITTDYGETPLNCAQTGASGVENYVGGASNGRLGVAAMRYTNPLTKSLHFQKSWFFLDEDVQVVLVSNISSASNASVISVLDQKLHNGQVMVNGKAVTTPSAQHGLRSQSLWHSNIGYTFPNTSDFSLSVEVAQKTGNWSAIGTSTQPPNTVDLLSAWLVHESLNASLAYTIFPGTDFNTFMKKSSSLRIQPWPFSGPPGGGSVNFTPGAPSAVTLSANGTAAVMFDMKSGVVTVSDPTQTLSALSVTLVIGGGNPGSLSKTLSFTMPSGGVAGSSVSQNV